MNVLNSTRPELNDDDLISTSSCNASIFANYPKSIKSLKYFYVITPNPNNNQYKNDNKEISVDNDAHMVINIYNNVGNTNNNGSSDRGYNNNRRKYYCPDNVNDGISNDDYYNND